MSEKFQPSEHDLKLADQNRGEIQDPEKIGAIRTPKAKESFYENEGKLIISPEGLMPENISAVVGARSAEKGAVAWTDRIFAGKAGIDSEKTVRVQQGHTGNVIEVTTSQAPAFDLIKDETGKVVEDKRLTKDGAKVDAAWTKVKDLTLMIGSADCAAVTIAGKDKEGKDIVGITHSGIAGTQKDLVGNLIGEMTSKGLGDINSFKVYVAPSICEKCYPILSETASEEQVKKSYGDTKKEISYDWEGSESKMEINLTSAGASFEKFRQKYSEKFKELFGRELSQNDLFYVAQNDQGINELHYRVDAQIFISLVCNGVKPENVGFSEVCTKNDGLPSSRGTKETTGVFSTITIK